MRGTVNPQPPHGSQVPVGPTPQEVQTAVARLSRDLRSAAEHMSDQEARYLVDAYYSMQDNRLRADNQARSMGEEPHGVILWLGEQNRIMEQQLKGALKRYAEGHPVGQWLLSIIGIGPVIAAGLLAHIDITRAPTAGGIWRYAGLDPSVTWGKGQKRPWNASLKTLCWKAGESFVKVSGKPDSLYGQVYAERKELEQQRNEAGQYAEQAASILQQKNIGRTTIAYSWYIEGKLPPGHIHARAKRYAVKLMLSHLHHVMYEQHYGEAPPKPYVIEHLGHTHYVPPPGWGD